MAKRLPYGRVETSREEPIANGTWKAIPRTGFVQIDGVPVAVRELHDSTAPIESATYFVERRPARKDPLAGMTMLTTPEEDFGTRRGGGSGEPA